LHQNQWLHKEFLLKLKIAHILAIFFSLLSITSIPVLADTVRQRFVWKYADPATQGLSVNGLESAWDVLEERNTRAFLVIRNDFIVFERYANGYNKNRRHYSASLAKSLVGGMSLLAALNDGLIKIDDPASKYIPSWRNDPLKSKITIRQLATHTSGLEDAESAGKSHKELRGWKRNFWKREPDPFTIARDHVPVIFEPGTDSAYSNPGFAMLGYAVTASLKNTSISDIRSLLKKRILDEIGVTENEWSIGYGDKPYMVDGMKLYATWGGASFTPRATARIGRLMLNKGNWQGSQLLSEKWIKAMVSYVGTPISGRKPGDFNPVSGLCWWINYDSAWHNIPRDAFAGAGAQQQVLLVVPSLNLIVVRNGRDLRDTLITRIKRKIFRSKGKQTFWGSINNYIFEPVLKSVKNR
jgi:CubicO group peptidase (beta-lactamase class C family)